MDTFIDWWQHLPFHINPVLLNLGPLQIRYYGLMYMTALLVAYALASYRLKTEDLGFKSDILEGFTTLGLIAVIIGARLGYVFFYNFAYFSAHPLEIVWPYQVVDGQAHFGLSGLSYHGSFVAAVAVIIFYCWKHKLNIWKFGDLIVSAIPLGYMFGRLGNFLNGELYGRVTSIPWGMYFPTAPTYELRHPSQLYEAFFEGLFLFCILWPLRRKKVFDGFLVVLYFIGYGLVRFIIEFYRQPDEQLGFILGSLSMGQILCLTMVLAGVVIGIYRMSAARQVKI